MADGPTKIAFGSEISKLKIGDAEIDCFIAEDGKYLLSKTGVQKALGYDGKSLTWFADIIENLRQLPSSENILPNPIEMLIKIVPFKKIDNTECVPAVFFILACKAIVLAQKKGHLNVAQLKMSRAAKIILLKFDEKILNRLIDEATGFQFAKDTAVTTLQQYLAHNLDDDSFQWVKTFPETFFNAILKMHHLAWSSVKNQPNIVGKIIYDVVFCRLSEELLADLRSTIPKRAYRRKDNRPQQIQHPQLQVYFDSLFTLIATSGYHWHIFLQLLNRAYPKNLAFSRKYSFNNNNDFKRSELSAFNTMLKKLA